MTMLLAQTAPDDSVLQAAGALLDFAVAAAQSNRGYWQQMWQGLFDSGLWAGLEWCAGGIAVFSAIFWGANFLRGLLEEDATPALADLIWPLLVIFFLVHPPGQRSNLARLIDGARTVPYVMVDQIQLRAATDTLDLQNVIRLAGYRIALEQLVRGIYNQCAALPVAAFQRCLQDNATEADEVVQALAALNPQAFAAEAEEISRVFRGELDPYTETRWSNQIFARDAVKDTLVVLLLSWQKDTLPMVEYALMASALMAPLCLAASLLPFGPRPIIGWLGGFVGICTAFVSYYVLMGLSAHNYLYNLGGFDTVAYLIKVGLLDPLFGLAVGVGGGRGWLSGAGALLPLGGSPGLSLFGRRP